MTMNYLNNHFYCILKFCNNDKKIEKKIKELKKELKKPINEIEFYVKIIDIITEAKITDFPKVFDYYTKKLRNYVDGNLDYRCFVDSETMIRLRDEK